MSEMKRFAERVADDMGKDGIDDEVLEEGQRRLELEQKVQILFKTPDVLDQVREDFHDDVWDEVKQRMEKWLQYGECLTVEFDLKDGTAQVMPPSAPQELRSFRNYP